MIKLLHRPATVVGALTIAALGAHALTQKKPDPKLRAKEIAQTFAPFAPSVKTRADEERFFVESNGFPDHDMMVGIVAWQQQVPLPQEYRGDNAWSFPLNPQPAAEPMSAKTGFFRGAIAIAANGVPIFNPIKNDGRTDTLVAGELDKFGGHGGRADDYHYHTAPLHLIDKVGSKLPIAYALDGYPIYGLKCLDGRAPKDLDAFNGHTYRGAYHYHATQAYPYLNGGFHGVVTERGGQVDPQPRARPVRPSLPPLRGAKITKFERLESNAFRITYEVYGERRSIRYALEKDGSYRFEFDDGNGKMRTEIYRPQGGNGKPGAEPGPKGRRPWILEHALEFDTNKDKTVTLAEVEALARSAMQTLLDGKSSVSVSALQSAPPLRSVLGGYFKGHASELDGNRDGSITLQEAIDEVVSLFHKSDSNHDHALTEDEYRTP